MKGQSDIVSTIHHLKLAQEHMQSFTRERPNAAFTRMFRSYSNKIHWILTDMKTDPIMPQIVRDGINQELNSDVFAVPAINEKIALLSPDLRELIETVIDQLLKGEKIQIEIDGNLQD